MGTDIHWILERRDLTGAWHAVASKDRFYETRYEGWESTGRRAEGRIGRRDYDLFAILSGVRGPAPDDRPLMTPGMPDDASSAVRADFALFGRYAHSWGWASGHEILSWSRLGEIKSWVADIAAFMDEGPIDEIIPDQFRNGQRWRVFPDLVGAETGHEALERASRSRTLIPWREDPSAWRLVVYYDN